MKMFKATALIGGLLIVASACGGDSRTSVLPTEPRLLVLVEASGPGLYHPFDLLQPRVPRLALYSDGTLVMLDESDEVHAGYKAARVREADLAKVMAAATAAGLEGPDRDLGFSGVADTLTARISVTHPGGTHTTVANGFWDGDGGTYTDAELAARRAVRDFVDRLTSPEPWWLVDGTDVYAPDTWAALWSRIPDLTELPFEARVESWPLGRDPRTAGQPVSEDNPTRCVVIDGPLAAELLRELKPGTVWEHRGDTFYLFLRPLLRHEAIDCTAASQ